jgi:hypothetical protein
MGVSVGIDPTEFASLTGPDSPPGGLLRVWKVFYNEDQQRNIVRALLACGMSQRGTLEERAENTAAAIQFFVPTFKNENFAGEQECRMIFTPEAGIQAKSEIPYWSRYAHSVFQPQGSAHPFGSASKRASDPHCPSRPQRKSS